MEDLSTVLTQKAEKLHCVLVVLSPTASEVSLLDCDFQPVEDLYTLQICSEVISDGYFSMKIQTYAVIVVFSAKIQTFLCLYFCWKIQSFALIALFSAKFQNL